MYPDRDEPGERLFLQLREVLPSLQHHQLPQGCKDFGEYWKASPDPSKGRGDARCEVRERGSWVTKTGLVSDENGGRE